jgi:acetoin utilization protein AcuC
MLPRFIGSEIYRLPVFKAPHPLAVPRAMLAADLCAAMGWLTDARYEDSPVASIAELCRFHTPDYIAALAQAEAEQDLPEQKRQTYRIGADANIIHPAVFRRPATSAGGALLAAGLTAHGGIVHAPGVGNHHGRPARASGFCFVNDIALGILRWRDFGVRRIAYLDLDAHHGDGVEDFFAADPEVLTISAHEAGRWPRTGVSCDSSRGVWNFAVPQGFNDNEFLLLLKEKILPLIADFRPDAIFLLPGADALADDPMAKLSLSNNAIWEAVGAVKGMAPRLVVGGGGGYNPYALARCWAGVWALLNDFPIPGTFPQAALDVLGGAKYFRAAGRNPPAHWLNTLRDPPAEGDVRDEVRAMIR